MAENTELDDPPRSIFMDSDDDEEIQRVSRPKKHILNDSSDDDEPGRVRYSSCRLNGDNGESEDRTSSHVSVPGPLDDSSADEESSPVEYSQGVESTLPTSLPLRCERSSDDQSDEEEASYVKSRCSSSVPQPAGSSSDSSQSSSSGESDDEVSIEAIKSKIISKTRAMKSTAVIEIPEGACDRSGNSKSKKEKVPSRKAKEAALAEIHSETQRMMRERKVSLPYHKPKQRTLEDFLNRRKSAPAVRLKTTSDELAKVWKHVEEREKNAELFYRSESDDDLVETDRAAMNSSIDSNTKKNPDEPPPGEISAPNNEIQIEADPQSNESEEFPRLQLSEILACSEDINNTVCENTSLPKSSEITRAEIDVVAPVTGNSTASTTAEIVSVESEPLETSNNTPDTFNNTSLSEKIDNLNLPISKCPKITGAPDEMIDLDDLSSKPGAFGLMKRFLKHAKLKPKKRIQDNTLNIISTEVDESGVVVGVSGETIKLKKEEPKPGERLVVLKTALQQKIAVNREQQLAKRMEEYRMYEDEFYGVDKTIDDELEEELLFDDEHHAQRAGKNLHEDVEDTDEKDVDNPFLDEEAAESGEDEVIEKIEEMGESEDKDENTDCEDDMDDNSSTSEDSDDESNSLQDTNEENATLPPIPTGLLELTGTQSAEAFNESQLIALCSGNFSSSTINLQKLETSSEEIQFQDVPDDEAGADTPRFRKALESDSDDAEVAIENKSQKKRKKLTFSDDEDDDVNGNVSDVDEEDAVDNEVVNENECVDEEDAAEQENVDDDDEEVELARKLGKGFLEHEAELSESEWGSDDEDEKGLDAYEEEEGDRDKISQRRLNKELGKIHAREVLAEDNREIRILQELLLEDGELHSDGPKRQRLFRWYNQDDDNAGEKRTLDFGENGGENEEDDEDIWRQQRLLRENFLRKKKIDNLDLQNVDSPVNFNDTRKGLKTTPKMSPAVPKSPDVKSQFSIFAKRGSFLNRGEKMLSKLAEITNNAGTKEKSLGNSRNNRNMVFSVVSPPKEFPAEEEQEIASKRKGEPLDKVAKKLKLGNRNNNCSTDRMSALAQLKLFESI